MELGLIGLGKMGGNMRERLRRAGHRVVGYDQNKEISDVNSISDLVDHCYQTPRIIWLMVPNEYVASVTEDLTQYLSPGDIIIDGGNSKWTEDAPRAEYLRTKGINFLDCGTSGGIWGLEQGYALMVGGDSDTVKYCQPIFDALKPPGEFGFVHAGAVGAGHFTKMVHNGIEYALMQAYAEGWELLESSPEVTNVRAVFQSWREGTVIRSWLLDLLVRALETDPELSNIRGYAEDSGEGRWTVNAALDLAVPVPTIAASLFARFVSRQTDSPAMKMVAAMRNQFGGHQIISEDSPH